MIHRGCMEKSMELMKNVSLTSAALNMDFHFNALSFYSVIIGCFLDFFYFFVSTLVSWLSSLPLHGSKMSDCIPCFCRGKNTVIDVCSASVGKCFFFIYTII